MKKWILMGALAVVSFTACKKNKDCKELAPTTMATAAETAYLQNYLDAKGITNAINKNGMFYVINQGAGISPNICSNISLTYSGSLIQGTTDGSVFDATPSGQTSNFNLASLITAWKIIFPLVKAGGSVTLYVPPSLGYGSRAAGSIPANSYLKFVVSLIDVQ
jgi:FKBP-type peptidyl-prolyl cis-trans isomerase FkpA